jgi:hypothetical protein
MTPEGKVKQEIKEYLASIGAYYFMPVQWGMGAATLDFLVCHNGKFIGIEVKRPGTVLRPSPAATPRQRRIISDIVAAGGFAFVTNDVETVKEYLTDVVRSRP